MKQREIYAISQDLTFPVKEYTQPGFAVFLEEDKNAQKSGEIKRISKVSRMHTEENYLFQFFSEHLSANFFNSKKYSKADEHINMKSYINQKDENNKDENNNVMEKIKQKENMNIKEKG